MKKCHRFWLRLRHAVILISNVSLKENKPDDVNPNSNDIDYYVQKNKGKIRWFSADCVKRYCMKNSVDNDVAQITHIHSGLLIYLILIITKYSLSEFLPSVHFRINKSYLFAGFFQVFPGVSRKV